MQETAGIPAKESNHQNPGRYRGPGRHSVPCCRLPPAPGIIPVRQDTKNNRKEPVMEISEYGSKSAPVILLQPVDEHDLAFIENEVSLIRERVSADFRLIAFKVPDWNNDLSPWPAPAVFGREGFGGGAENTLKEILRYCECMAGTYYIGGYSLAGLFALWAAYRTDLFRGVAAASPSVWFPGFPEFMREHRIQAGRVYLSLGDREEKTRNPVMAKVGDNIRAACDILEKQGVGYELEWNEGNHFRDADLRTAKAFSRIMNRQP